MWAYAVLALVLSAGCLWWYYRRVPSEQRSAGFFILALFLLLVPLPLLLVVGVYPYLFPSYVIIVDYPPVWALP